MAGEEKSDYEEAQGLRVLKRDTQEVLARLRATPGVVADHLKIQATPGEVLIPLATSVKPSDIATILGPNHPGQLGVFSFPARPSPPPSLEDYLKKDVPPNLWPHLPHSWDVVGRLLIFEVPRDYHEAFQPYLHTIGQAFLALHKNVVAVFVKGGDVEGEFRVRDLQWVAGEASTETEYRENACRFKLDLARVFFTPRLVTERARVTQLICEDPAPVVDLFAGVGSFVLQAAKHCGVRGFAFDVNPEAIAYCRENARLNHVEHLVEVFHDDARRVHHVISKFPEIVDARKHIIMNLPERALEFAGPAIDLIRDSGGWLHLYQFNEEPEPLDQARVKFSEALRERPHIAWNVVSTRVVKPYAPGKVTTVMDIEILPQDLED